MGCLGDFRYIPGTNMGLLFLIFIRSVEAILLVFCIFKAKWNVANQFENHLFFIFYFF